MTDLDQARRPGEFVFVEADAAPGAEAADHLLVPAGPADEAIEVLCALRY